MTNPTSVALTRIDVGLKPGAMAGVVITTALAVIALLLLTVYCVRRGRRRSAAPSVFREVHRYRVKPEGARELDLRFPDGELLAKEYITTKCYQSLSGSAQHSKMLTGIQAVGLFIGVAPLIQDTNQLQMQDILCKCPDYSLTPSTNGSPRWLFRASCIVKKLSSDKGPHPEPMSTTPVFTGIDLSSLLDVPFSGLLISIALYGVIVVQAWTYFNRNKDNWLLRLLVLSMVVLDLAASVLEIIPYRYLLIVHFGNVLAVTSEKSIRHTMETVIISAVIAFIVQIFFASRVYVLNRLHRVVPVFIILCAIGTLAMGLCMILILIDFLERKFKHPSPVIGIQGIMHPSIRLLFDPKTKLKLGLSCGLAALCDLSATMALTWSFRMSKTGFKMTDTMLYKLLQFTVTRGILVTLVQVSLFALYVGDDPVKLKWTAPLFCGSKVYVITMLAILNSRSSLRGDSSAVLVSVRNTQNSTISERDTEQPADDLERGYVLHPLNSRGAEQTSDSKSLPKPPITDPNEWWAAPEPEVVVKRETMTLTT
uniref:DUF6534 domain-containing protein n=1 Tax=Moniliophthora roreri TaxID=221103 RepID=A0A0W0GFL9_MONRR